MRRYWRAILSYIGIGLLLLNLAGFVLPLRSPRLADYQGKGGDLLRVPADGAALYRLAQRQPAEPLARYLHRLTTLVHDAILHYRRPIDTFSYHLWVPPWENWLLFLAGVVYPFWRYYEFCDPARGLRRGIGLCSQQAVVVWGILSRQGIPARILALNHHVMALAQVAPSRWWILDPNLGVVIPCGPQEAARRPELVVETLRAAGYPESKLSWAREAFAHQTKRIFSSVEEYLPRRCRLERMAYMGKWLLPVILLLPWLWHHLRKPRE